MWIDIKPGVITETEIALPVIDEATLKHLSGQHDQSTHGSWAGYKPNDVDSWGEERSKVLDKTKGGPSVAELNDYFNSSSLIEARSKLEKIKTKVEDLYNEDIKGNDGMLYKIKINKVYDVSEVTDDQEKRYSISLEGEIRDFTNQYIGEFKRSIERGYPSLGVVVSHDLLNIEPEFQGNGIGSQFTMRSENKYIVNGYEKIVVHAGLEKGGYVWAKAGFSWDDGSKLTEIGRKQNIKDMVSRWKDMGENDAEVYDILSSNPSTRKRFDSLVNKLSTESYDSKNLPTPYDLASFEGDAGEKIGRKIMEFSKWYGVKYLTPSGKQNNA